MGDNIFVFLISGVEFLLLFFSDKLLLFHVSLESCVMVSFW